MALSIRTLKLNLTITIPVPSFRRVRSTRAARRYTEEFFGADMIALSDMAAGLPLMVYAPSVAESRRMIESRAQNLAA